MNKLNIDRFIKKIESKKGELPKLDPYRSMKDWHTQNSIAFNGKEFIYSVFNQGEKNFTLGDVATGKFKDKVKDKDKKLTFKSGFQAVRGYFRKKSKATGLGLMYGGGAGLIETAFEVSKAESIKLFAIFFSTLKVLKRHLDNRVETAMQNMYIETLFGRRLYLPQLGDRSKKNEGIRKTYNSPIQGTASELIKIFMYKMGEWVEKLKLSKYQGNNIADVVNGQWYNRIVTEKESDIDKLFNIRIKRLQNGHTRLLILNNRGEVVKESERALNIDYATFEMYSMEVIH